MAPGSPSAARSSTRSEDAVLLVLSACLLGGLFLDGYAHAYVIDTATEDFFTPWHAIFYAAFAAVAGWIGIIGYRRRAPGSVLSWFPRSHHLGIVGLALFASGGIGDGVWHTIFGVENGIDALLSPTHLLLLFGGLFILWSPVRAGVERGDSSPWLPIGSVIIATAALTFFIEYLWLLPWTQYALQPFDPITQEGTWAIREFLGATIATVLVLLAPLLLLVRRWPLPFGAASLVWTTSAALHAAAFSRQFRPVLLVLLGGLAFDLALRATRQRRWGLGLAAGLGPSVIFAGYLIGASIDGPLGWPPEIWCGVIFVAAGEGVGLSLLQRSGSATPVAPYRQG